MLGTEDAAGMSHLPKERLDLSNLFLITQHKGVRAKRRVRRGSGMVVAQQLGPSGGGSVVEAHLSFDPPSTFL